MTTRSQTSLKPSPSLAMTRYLALRTTAGIVGSDSCPEPGDNPNVRTENMITLYKCPEGDSESPLGAMQWLLADIVFISYFISRESGEENERSISPQSR